MKTKTDNGRIEVVDQQSVMIPDLTIKDLLSQIPAHCFERSAFRSSLYVVWDFFLIACIYKGTEFADTLITPEVFPNAYLRSFARFALWAIYAFANGLVMTGLWVIAHECGHQAFSESKTVNNTVGWFLHSALGVPYHSWRITHAKHHASTAHMTQDQVFVPKTRSQLGLPAFNAEEETLDGTSVSQKVANELWEAVGDSPLGATLGFASYLLVGWPMYLITNASGQKRYPSNTNHFNPSAENIFAPHHFWQIIMSDIGVFVWVAGIIAAIYNFGFTNTFSVYLAPYLWVNHWLILITFLQHTDPIIPHYRASEFTFPRGALATLDRNLLGDLGSFMGWIGACTTHGISETHVAHHVNSKIPHYHAWEANAALHKRLVKAGIHLQGAPGGWAEMYRVFRECKFVEDEGEILFYKNSKGLAATRPVFANQDASDSGIEIDAGKEN
ncbi:oleoyl phosphatidylcholine desaturase [Cytidiella melzeri]|nr:oleoyl phosphatidylcholine desaturase [Cytidiella melzeri]